MASNPDRQQRVAEGSNRKRDLAATKFDNEAYRAKHFPTENIWPVQAAVFRVRKSNGGSYPAPADVLAYMQDKGWTLKQREAL